MKYRIVVDPELCIGAAACVTVDPAHFAMNEENKAVVLDPKIPGEAKGPYERTVEMSDAEKETLILAAESCPTLAVSVFDESGKKIFPEF
ncbi:MAG: ferredoxin [Candidatus Woesebacteria bacterium]|nr:ferredoxin [Candidatus Woesebacteria bacterium]